MLVLRPLMNYTALQIWLMERQWTPESIIEWQEFYNNASRFLYFGYGRNFSYEILPKLPAYKDLTPPPCHKGIPPSTIRENPLQEKTTNFKTSRLHETPENLKRLQQQKLQIFKRLRKTS